MGRIKFKVDTFFQRIKKVFFELKKMANFSSKELKFNLDACRELCARDLIINIWSYNSEPVHQPTYVACKTYCDYCTQALREKWEADWGDFEFAKDKFKVLLTLDNIPVQICT